MSSEEVASRIELARYDTRAVEPGSREKLLDRIAWAAYYNDRVYEGCARCVLHALQTHLHLGNGATIQASTALAGGVARMGETCGALIGGIMAIGLVLGREDLSDIGAYRKTMEASYRLYDRFRQEVGDTICHNVQSELFGRTFDFKVAHEAESWYEEDGLHRCPAVCAVGARLAAGIILDIRQDPVAPE
jgi:C_GCAxxG_C_C family probable redox protein